MPRLPLKVPRRHRRPIGPSAPPSAICPTPATQNDGGCDFVPRLPRETKVDVRLCHACHAKCRGVTGAQAGPSAPPSAICPTPATQNDGGCDFVPRLPRETKVDVRLCHACHAKCRGVTGAQAGPSAPPSAICPTPATQNDGGCEFVPRLPRRWMSGCATPATQSAAASQAPKPVQARHPVPSVPRLPRKTKLLYVKFVTVRALSRINFVVFGQLVGVELPRGVASIFVVPCKNRYRNHSKYHSFVVFFRLIPCGTCCHGLSRNLCASYIDR